MGHFILELVLIAMCHQSTDQQHTRCTKAQQDLIGGRETADQRLIASLFYFTSDAKDTGLCYH